MMLCLHCDNEIESDSKFCIHCGNAIFFNGSVIDERKIDMDVTFVKTNNPAEVCEICGAHAPVKYNEFYANIGMLFARRQMHVKARMCKQCTNRYFWKYTFTNLFLGWWGLISFFATILFMLNNVVRYMATLSLKAKY